MSLCKRRPDFRTCNASRHVQPKQNINNQPSREVMATTSACFEGDFVFCNSLYFLPLMLKSHAVDIAVQADAKVILNVRMIETDIRPVASEWADALLQNVGCQVSALITHLGWLRGVGRLLEGNSCAFTQCRKTLLHYQLEQNGHATAIFHT